MRAERHAWLTGRGYRVLNVAMAEVENDIDVVLDTIADNITGPRQSGETR
jgi:very-short-patch-repair endonuclease